MGAKVLLKGSAAAVELSKAVNRCYFIAESGEEVSVTKDMVKGACKQLLARCKKTALS